LLSFTNFLLNVIEHDAYAQVTNRAFCVKSKTQMENRDIGDLEMSDRNLKENIKNLRHENHVIKGRLSLLEAQLQKQLIKKPPECNPSLLESLKAVFIDCFSSSTVHGLEHLVKPRHLIFKIFWVPIFLASVIACLILVVQTVCQYNDFDFSTVTVIQREYPMIMPSITICSHRNIKQKLLHCSFGDNPAVACNIGNLTIFNNGVTPQECIRLDLSKNNTKLLQQAERYNYGYSLVFYKPPMTSITFGVTDNEVLPVEKDTKNPLNPGVVDIVLSKMRQESLGQPYSNCKDSAGYRQKNCVQDCFSRVMSRICGCQFPELCPLPRNDTCLKAWHTEAKIEAECRLTECPLECKLVTFDLNLVNYVDNERTVLEKFRPVIFEKFSVANLTNDELEARLIDASFYFERFETNVITQTPSMTILDLVAAIGGLMGILICSLFYIFDEVALKIKLHNIIKRALSWNEPGVDYGGL